MNKIRKNKYTKCCSYQQKSWVILHDRMCVCFCDFLWTMPCIVAKIKFYMSRWESSKYMQVPMFNVHFQFGELDMISLWQTKILLFFSCYFLNFLLLTFWWQDIIACNKNDVLSFVGGKLLMTRKLVKISLSGIKNLMEQTNWHISHEWCWFHSQSLFFF